MKITDPIDRPFCYNGSMHCASDQRVTRMHKDAPPIIGTGTDEDVLKSLVRYHDSSGAAMLLHDDDERFKSNI